MSSTTQKHTRFSSVFLLISALSATPCLAQVAKIELNSIDDGDKVRGLAMLRDDEAILTLIDRGERMEISEWSCKTGEERAILQAEGGQSVPVDFRVSIDSKFLIFARTGRGAWSFETVSIESGDVLASVKFRDADGFADDSREFKSPERIEFSPDLATAYAIFNKNSADQLPPHSELRV